MLSKLFLLLITFLTELYLALLAIKKDTREGTKLFNRESEPSVFKCRNGVMDIIGCDCCTFLQGFLDIKKLQKSLRKQLIAQLQFALRNERSPR